MSLRDRDLHESIASQPGVISNRTGYISYSPRSRIASLFEPKIKNQIPENKRSIKRVNHVRMA